MNFRNILKNRTSTALCVAFSIFSMIGWTFCTYPDEDFLFDSSAKPLILSGVLIGFFVLYKLIISLAQLFFIRIKSGSSISLFEGRVFVKMLFISFFVYGLWWFAFFPGTLHPDMTHHLYQGLGIQPLSKIVPVFLTKLVGAIMTVSKVVFKNDNVGGMIYVGGLYAAQCLIVSYMFLLFKKMGTPTAVRWVAFFFVFLMPVLPIWGVNFGKDTPYYLFLLLFMCCMADLIITDKPEWSKYMLLAVSILGVSLCRNNGAAMVMPAIIVYVAFVRKNIKRFFTFCVICILILIGTDKFFESRCEIGGLPIRENLSIPIQTYVSFLREYKDELSNEDAMDIYELFSASPEELVDSYDPMISDPVKNRFVYDPTKEQMEVFWRLWWTGFKSHPGVFIRGFMRHAYGYFYPGKDCFSNRTAIYTLNLHTEYYTFEFAMKESPLRDKFIALCEGIYKFPLTNILYRPGFQMYVLIFLALVIVMSKHKNYICVLVPNLMMLFVFLSPVNAYFRYMLPVFVTLPMSIAWTIYTKGNNVGANDEC